jgi:preprotein translocase subunit YajC
MKINDLFSIIPAAHAQSSSSSIAGFDFMSLMPFLLLFVVMYFLILRPQQKRAKEHKAMLSAVRRGDRVITAGGLIGVVNRIVSEEEVEIEIAQGTNVRVVRSMISHVLAKTVPGAPSATNTSSASENTNKKIAKKNPFKVVKKTKDNSKK